MIGGHSLERKVLIIVFYKKCFNYRLKGEGLPSMYFAHRM